MGMRSTPVPPPDPAEVAQAEWIGRQLEALLVDDRVHPENVLGTRAKGVDPVALRRYAWAWYR